MDDKKDKIVSLIMEAAWNEDIIVDVIENRKTGQEVTVVTDYYNCSRMRSIEHPKRETVITEGKIINVNQVRNRLYKRKLDKAKDEYAKTISREPERWSLADKVAFKQQLKVKLKTESELDQFKAWMEQQEEETTVQ